MLFLLELGVHRLNQTVVGDGGTTNKDIGLAHLRLDRIEHLTCGGDINTLDVVWRGQVRRSRNQGDVRAHRSGHLR